MMVALYRAFDAPMCDSLLFRWHESLMHGRRDLANMGGYRTGPNPMQVVSGLLHDPKIHFEAPPSAATPAEIKRFMQWFSRTSRVGETPLPILSPMMLRNLYGIALGTSGLILQARSHEEILAKKMVALAFRENRVKKRALWDIAWLVLQGVALAAELILVKIWGHRREAVEFVSLLQSRFAALKAEPQLRDDFLKEVRRILPAITMRDTLENSAWWTYLTQITQEQVRLALAQL